MESCCASTLSSWSYEGCASRALELESPNFRALAGIARCAARRAPGVRVARVLLAPPPPPAPNAVPFWIDSSRFSSTSWSGFADRSTPSPPDSSADASAATPDRRAVCKRFASSFRCLSSSARRFFSSSSFFFLRSLAATC